jgi:type III secretion system low calcium response chaperone LcrH/SycD
MENTTAARYLQYLIQVFYNGLVGLAELEGTSDEDMETVYTLGYNFFTYGKYTAAKDIFTGLTVNAPYTAHYWRALGAVNQQLKDYPEAISAYEMAIANDPNDIVSRVYKAESYILSGNIEAGIQELESVQSITEENRDSQNKPWNTRAKLLLQIHKPT